MTPSKEGHVLVLAQGLAYGESEVVATVILEYIQELFGKPGVIVSDYAQGFRKAVLKVFPEAIHKSCGYHLIVNWNKRFAKFKNAEDILPGKILLRKTATTIDVAQSKTCWDELEALCDKNLSNAHSDFIMYYRDGRCFWTLAGVPKTVYVGYNFSNSITESSNSMV